MPFSGTEGLFFLGNLPSDFQKFVSGVAAAASKAGYSRFVEPCAGQLVMSQIATEAGFKDIEASDVTIMSGVLGRCVEGRSLADMRIADRLTGAVLEDPVELLMTMKRAQLRAGCGTIYGEGMYRDFLSREDAIREEIANTLEGMKGAIPSLRYADQDMFDHLRDVKHDSAVLAVCNPPTYSGGYEKQYAALTGAVTWNEPPYEMFDPKEGYWALMNELADAECLYLMYEEVPDGCAIGTPVFARAASRDGMTAYMVSNRPEEIERLVGKTVKVSAPSMKPSKYPLLPEDHELTKRSKLEVVNLAPENIRWYRKLFTHNFTPSGTSTGYGVVIDGYLAGIFGYLDMSFGGNVKDAFIGFLMSVKSPYRLNRLIYKVAMQRRTVALAYTDLQLYDVKGVATAMIADHKRLNEMRGLMECVEQKPDDTMKYRLKYRGEMEDLDYRKVLRWFIQNEKEYHDRKH